MKHFTVLADVKRSGSIKLSAHGIRCHNDQLIPMRRGDLIRFQQITQFCCCLLLTLSFICLYQQLNAMSQYFSYEKLCFMVYIGTFMPIIQCTSFTCKFGTSFTCKFGSWSLQTTGSPNPGSCTSDPRRM